MIPDTRELAVALAAQSDRLDQLVDERKAAAAAADAVTRVTVQRPGAEPSPADLRAWAIQQAISDGKATLRPSRGEAPVSYIICPDTADAVDGLWERRIREQENALLIAAYGRRQCERAGLL